MSREEPEDATNSDVGLTQNDLPPHVLWQVLEIVQTTADVVISIDKSERISFINSAAESFFGYKPQDLVGKPLSVLLPPTYRSGHSRLVEGFRNASDTARMMAQRRPVFGLKKDGQMVPIEISIMKHKRQGPFVMTAVIRDASETISLQTRNLESDRRYRAILESRTKATLVLSAAGRIIDLNGLARAQADIVREDLVGRHIWDAPWWRGEERRDILRELVENPEDGTRSTLTMEADFGDDKVRKLSLTLTPVRQEEDATTFIIAEWQDRAMPKAGVDGAQKHKAQLDLLERVTRTGIWEIEFSTQELHWSSEVYRIFGLDPENTRPSIDAFKQHIHPEDWGALEQAWQESVESGVGFTIFYRILPPDGSVKMVQNTAEIISSHDGKPFLAVGTIQDITESWLREKELSAALRQAETASLAKSRFLANLGHELRTPLNAVIGFGQFIAGQDGPMEVEKATEYAGYIVAGGSKLLTLVNDIILTSQLDATMVTLQEEPTDLEHIMRCVVQSQREAAEQKNISLVRELGAAGETTILGDEKLLVHAISKILGNAIKFGHEGGSVTIRADQDETGFHIAIEDDGDGLSEEMVSEALQPFFQADELNRRTDGIGLGLGIAREIMKLHDGGVRLENLPSEGAVVRLSLPLSRVVSGELP